MACFAESLLIDKIVDGIGFPLKKRSGRKELVLKKVTGTNLQIHLAIRCANPVKTGFYNSEEAFQRGIMDTFVFQAVTV